MKAEFGIVVPAERISVADAVARRPGFVTHGMLDPNRRSDPDNTKTGEAFPWDEFFGYFRAEMGAPITALSQEDQDIMYLDIVREIYEAHGRGGPKDRRAMHIWAFDLAANAGNLNSVARQTEIIDYIDYKLGGGK